MAARILYHAFRNTLIGDTLLPLSELQGAGNLRNVHEQRLKSYQGRESLLQTRIPILDCTWRDVVFLCAISPTCVFDELEDAIQEKASSRLQGFRERRAHWKAIPFDISEFDPDRLVVFFSGKGEPAPDQFISFSEGVWPSLLRFSEWTRQYYREKILAGEPPLLWKGLPHILYKGKIAIGQRDILTI